MVIISEISSSSSSTLVPRYDVFLSFRGFDTRFNFTDHLYNALLSANITTFLDDEEIETGLSLKPELEIAIRSSRASIIVLSQNYASSSWCLNELVLILEQLRNSDHIVIPIFYHVEPTDVRKQQNSFGEAMAEHKQRMETEANAEKRSQWAQKIDLWNKALAEVADLKGEIAKGRKETELIDKIVTGILRKLGVPLNSSSTLLPLIGMDYHIKYITSWLKDKSSHTADILTIWGMGGIGKTSLAEYVFKLHSHEFQRSSFIADISRKCAERSGGLLDLQKQICYDISNTSSVPLHHVSTYTSQIENAIARTMVYVVLDDVDSPDHLDALLGKKGFHPGSKIIITTKDASLTEKCELFNQIVQPKHKKHLLQGLDDYKSLQLLSVWAFKRNSPKEGYEEVSNTLVKYCGGHPLALKVLGRSLRDKDVVEWEDCIERLKEEPDPSITKVLQLSFDSLQSTEDKELFLHIACFFVGKDRKSTETILKACRIHTRLGIKNLVDRCLLSIDNDKLMMHQLLQEMGRDVVRQESPNKPWKRSRLWRHEESLSVLEQNKGSGKLKGLVLDMEMHEEDDRYGLFELKIDALSKMDNLMLLQLNYVKLNGSYKNFPQKLRWLCMHRFPLEYMPPDLQLENLVIFDMSYSKLVSFDMSYGNQQPPRKRQKLTGLDSICGLLELPVPENRQKFTESRSKDEPLLRSLKILNLSYCAWLRNIGGFSEFPALERLILSNCTSLIEVCESIEQCDGLEHIDLSYCNDAGKLLRTIGKVKNVKILKLDGCNLGEFPINGNNIGMNSQTFSSAFVEAIPRALECLWIYLPSSLVRLSLKDNHMCNETFPMDMSSLFMLKTLYLDGNDIVSMPNCVRTLPRLEKLSIKKCARLTTIEHPPCTLKELRYGFSDERKVVFDREMSPIILNSSLDHLDTYLGSFIEGLWKVGDAEEEVLRSLGWSNLDFTKIQPTRTGSKVKVRYEFGIFSAHYVGKEMPNWIRDRREGSSISFTIPSSPNNLTGFNFCFLLMVVPNTSVYSSRHIKVSNITKKCTWIYAWRVFLEKTREGNVIYLSHWMFGKNEMEDGDQITLTVSKSSENPVSIRECGVSFVYDEDGKKKMEEEEDALGYYKSWNHIIGGDLSPFQTTTPGEYVLDQDHFFGNSCFDDYVDKRPLFRALRQSN